MSQGYDESISCFRPLAKDNNVCREITEGEIRSEIGYQLYVFNVRYQNRYSAPQFAKITIRVTTATAVSSFAGSAPVLKNLKH